MTTRLPPLALLFTALLAGPAAAETAAPHPDEPRVLRVSGESAVAVRPDVAVILAGVQSNGPSLPRVTRETAAQLRKVMDALRAAGVRDEDIQTAQHQIEVERSWKGGRMGPVTGYALHDQLRITVRDVETVGTVVERLLGAGANTMQSISFQKGDPTADQARALAAAYASARSKGEALARAAGVALGDVVSVGERVQTPPAEYSLAVARKSAYAESVSPGQVEISAAVDVVYAIR